jgi:hypothetical protein
MMCKNIKQKRQQRGSYEDHKTIQIKFFSLKVALQYTKQMMNHIGIG